MNHIATLYQALLARLTGAQPAPTIQQPQAHLDGMEEFANNLEECVDKLYTLLTTSQKRPPKLN